MIKRLFVTWALCRSDPRRDGTGSPSRDGIPNTFERGESRPPLARATASADREEVPSPSQPAGRSPWPYPRTARRSPPVAAMARSSSSMRTGEKRLDLAGVTRGYYPVRFHPGRQRPSRACAMTINCGSGTRPPED